MQTGIRKTVLNPLASYLVPPVCVVCNKKRYAGLPVCIRCYKKLHLDLQPSSQGEAHDLQYLSSHHYLFRLNRVISILIHGLKYKSFARNGRFLISTLRFRKDLIEYIRKYDVLCPVPLHKLRKKERGYNQAEVLCKSIEVITGVPYRNDLLIRTKNTRTQTKLNREKRKSNLRGSIKCANPALINRKKILIVDDVLTTGSTCAIAAQILLEAGAGEVGGFTLSKTSTDWDPREIAHELTVAGSFSW